MILLSTPTWRNISNLSPFFVPPRNSKIATSSNFLRLHVLEEEGRDYEDKDIDLITSQTPKWTFNITGVRKQIRFFSEICALIFGRNSLLVSNLRLWDSHILTNQQSYEEYQSSHKYFICSVLNKIHQKVQRFLMKCQEGWEEINWRIFDSNDIQDGIISENYHVEKPSWVIEKDSYKHNKNRGNTNNGNRIDNKNKQYKTDTDASQEINFDKDPRLNIPDSSVKYGTLQYCTVFVSYNRSTILTIEEYVQCHTVHTLLVLQKSVQSFDI